MQFIGKPKPLLPLMNTKDCSLRLCTPLCPQWCDAIFPPPSPPPPLAAFPDDKPHSSPTFSPLVIAIIGILASAFLLVSYYAIISKYCGRNNSNSSSSSRIGRETRPPNHEDIFDEGYDGASNIIEQHEPWLINTPGLDEALIKSITLVKFKKSDGLICCADCSVCLGEFLEDDTLRLLPKCSHAFHVACIDTWLRSHSNCPLCRANIVSSFSQPPPPNTNNNNYHNYNPPLVVDDDNTNSNANSNNNGNNVQDHNTLLENQVANEEMISSSGEERQINIVYEPKTPSRALSDLSARGHGGRNSITRSISMDHRYDAHLSIPDVFRCNLIQEEDCTVKTCQFHDQSLKRAAGESSKYGVCNSSSSSSNRNGVLHCVMSSVAMKRSFSSGRILFSKCGRGKNAVIIPP